MQHLSFVLSRQSDQVLQEQLGIGFSQFKIMMVLQSDPSVQQKHIADKLSQTEASISRQIKLLHDDGMLTSQVRPENRRQHITRLTPKGERIIDKAMEILNNYHAPVFSQLSAKQQDQFLDALKTLHQHACHTEHAGPFSTTNKQTL